MDIEINLEELAAESVADDHARVRDAFKDLVGEGKRVVKSGDDVDEIVDVLKLGTAQLNSGRHSIRVHQPIRQLSAGDSNGTPQLSPRVAQALNELAAHFNGDLEAALKFMSGLQETNAEQERKLAELNAENRRLSTNAGAIDADEIARVKKLETDLAKANADLDQAHDELDTLRAQRPVVDDLIRVLKKDGEIKSPRLGKETFTVPGDKLKPEHRRLLEV